MTDTYTIPFQDQTVIYRPRRHLAFIGNAALAGYIENRLQSAVPRTEIETFLEAVGFDRPGLECPPAVLGAGAPQPTGAVLLLTNRCNLRCVYCYANAGTEARLSEMPWPTAQAAIDFVVANAQHPDAEPPSLTFHGGGEPTVHWDLLARAVDYARQCDSRTLFSMSSNGIWSEAQRAFVCRHFNDVSLSMDGAAAIQDRQRPRVDGGGSFASVMESIRSLDAAGVAYGIRMTVLEASVARLPAGVDFLCRNTQTKAIQVEPTFTSHRGHYADIGIGFADAFAERFMEAWRIGRAAGRQVYYSGARPWVIAPMFCQAPLKAAVVTADGRLVTCFEVFGEENPLAGRFTVGRISGGKVAYERAALQAFLDAQQARRAACEDCFCYWHCCGDCATRRPGGRETAAGRCRATRSITQALILSYIEEGDGVWQGLRATPPGETDAL